MYQNDDIDTQVDEPEVSEVPAAPQMPIWARLIKDTVFIPAREMESGDTIYLSNIAYPRILWTQVSRTYWSVLVVQHGIHVRGQITIDPDQYYVVKRAVKK